MKLLKLSLLTITMLLMPLLFLPKRMKCNQAYWIHEDRVKPRMTDEYEQIPRTSLPFAKSITFKKPLADHGLNDNSYLYVTPIDNMASLDENGFKTLSEKMGCR